MSNLDAKKAADVMAKTIQGFVWSFAAELSLREEFKSRNRCGKSVNQNDISQIPKGLTEWRTRE